MSAPVTAAEPESLMQRLGDRLNPLVVKEVRQGLRSRVFWVSFGLMLLACFILSLVAYAATRDAGLTTHGQGYFFAFFHAQNSLAGGTLIHSKPRSTRSKCGWMK